jgi:hypothetical protein
MCDISETTEYGKSIPSSADCLQLFREYRFQEIERKIKFILSTLPLCLSFEERRRQALHLIPQSAPKQNFFYDVEPVLKGFTYKIPGTQIPIEGSAQPRQLAEVEGGC